MVNRNSLPLLSVILILFSISTATKPNIITSLPGFPGNLPFHLETGYVGVGKSEEVQLFYYFVESEGDPRRDPLLLWLTGGPGCSAFSGLSIEIGPLNLNDSSSSWESETPSFQLNPFSWTKAASILFVDAPVGTGFSYATTLESSYSNDILQSWHIYEFLRKTLASVGSVSFGVKYKMASLWNGHGCMTMGKGSLLVLDTLDLKWLVDHIEFKDNPLYISGDSYCGIIVPIVVQYIINGNKAEVAPNMNLKGYILGNPATREEDQTVSKVQYAERVSLLSSELYESTKECLNVTYEDADEDCRKHLQVISDNLDPLFDAHVLEPKCLTPQTQCQETSYQLLFTWANNAEVQKTLQIREGTKSQWIRCNGTLGYAYNIVSTFGYHQNFTNELLRALIYSGDQDMKISYVGTLDWIKNLCIKVVDDWRPWFVQNQVAGYTMKFSNGRYDLTFATLKGAGHTAPEYKRQESLAMLMRWLRMDPL